jgi:hypothetical protein
VAAPKPAARVRRAGARQGGRVAAARRATRGWFAGCSPPSVRAAVTAAAFSRHPTRRVRADTVSRPRPAPCAACTHCPVPACVPPPRREPGHHAAQVHVQALWHGPGPGGQTLHVCAWLGVRRGPRRCCCSSPRLCATRHPSSPTHDVSRRHSAGLVSARACTHRHARTPGQRCSASLRE